MADAKFMSRYTGTQIDTLLSSIVDKISYSDIDNAWTNDTQKVASAAEAYQLYQFQNQFSVPTWVKNLFLTIPNSVIFTTDDQAILTKLNHGWQGTFADSTTRQNNLVTTNFIGGEVSLILNNGGGLQELDYWDAIAHAWVPCQWTGSLKGPDQAEATGGSYVVLQWNRFQVNTVKFLIRSATASDICVVEFLGTVKGSNTFWNAQGFVGSNPSLITVQSMTIVGDNVEVLMYLQAGSTTNFYKLAEF